MHDSADALHQALRLVPLEQGKETEQLRRVIRVLKLLGVRATLQKADW